MDGPGVWVVPTTVAYAGCRSGRAPSGDLLYCAGEFSAGLVL